jgi:hypothetical protein
MNLADILHTYSFQFLRFNTLHYSMTDPSFVNDHPSCSIVQPNTTPSLADARFHSYMCLTKASKDVCIPGILWMDETVAISSFESVTIC